MTTDIAYFIRCESTGLVKIGYASDAARRLAELQTGNPTRLKVLGVLPGGQKTEAKLHRQFAAHRRSGEWFALSDEVVAEALGVEYVPPRDALRIHEGELWAPAHFCGVDDRLAILFDFPMLIVCGEIYHPLRVVVAWHDEPRNKSRWDAETLEAARLSLTRFDAGQTEDVA